MFRRIFPLGVASAAALGFAAAAPVAAQAVDQDMKCMIASNVFATAEKDPPKKQLAMGAYFFYLGRVNARIAPAQMKAVVIAQGKALNGQNLGQTMTTCAQRLQATQRAMQALGKDIAGSQPKK